MQQPSGPAIVFDDDLGDANAQLVRDLLGSGRISQAETWLEAVRHWDARTFYIDAASRWEGRPPWLDSWVLDEPGSALAHLVRGAHSIHWAWEARGNGWDPAPGAEPLFQQRLAMAEADLSRAAELDPADPTAPCLLLRVARGRQLSLAEKSERYQELIHRDPGHRRGHTEMLRAMAAKWGGSHDLMFQFARDRAAKAPPGSPLNTLPVEAHVERWLVTDRTGFDAGYWRRPEVVEEVRHAAAVYFDDPGFQPSPLTLFDRSYFAFAFTEIGDWAAARRQFQAMSQPFRWPWAMFGDAAQLIMAARGRALEGS